MIKQGLELKQTQKLSPLQIQTIKLIELPVMELEQKVREELYDNPVLDDTAPGGDDGEPKNVSISEMEDKENKEDGAADEYASYSDDYIPGYNLRTNNYGPDERPAYDTFSVRQSFTQSLMEQLGFRRLDEHEKTVAQFIIGSLDDDGYLRRDIESIVDDLAFRANVETDADEVERMLGIIQQFEPAGVGARNLKECLLLQLKGKKQTSSVKNAAAVLEGFFEDFSNKHFQRIMSRLKLSEDDMKDVLKEIKRLNPSPGGQIDDSYDDQAQQIVPDFRLDYDNGQLILSMPRFNIPELKVNRRYADILENSRYTTERSQKEAASFVKQKIDSAKWFIEALRQRQNTLESTMRAIIEYQHDFFIDGNESHLRPMVLKDIAEKTGFDISTISRVVNSKYIETHFGIFQLKHFFSEGLENQAGEEVSTREIKKVLRECVDGEDKNNPLTDDELVEELNRRGYKVARRTIAKYRSQLDIPKARLRREL